MERVNIVVIASLAAALGLLGLRLFAPSAAPDLTTASADGGPAFGPDGLRDHRLPPSRIAMHGEEDRHAPKPPGRGGPPPEEERRGSGGVGSRSGSGQSTALIAGVERRRDVLGAAQGSSGSIATEIPADGLPDSVLGARNAAVPPPQAAARDLPPADTTKRHTFEFVDQAPKQGTTADDLVLSIPFKGDVKPEVGGDGMQSDGLVSNGGQVEFPTDAQLTFPAGGNVNSKMGTISFDIDPQWAGADETNNSLVQIRDEHTWENALQIVKNFASLRYIIIDSGGVEHDVNVPIDTWPSGESRTVTATWDDSNMTLYMNGQLVGQNTLANPLAFNDATPIHVGSDFPGASYSGAGGSISDFKVYGRALGADEIH